MNLISNVGGHVNVGIAERLAAAAPTPQDLMALHQRLEQEADRAGVLDIAYRTLDTPVGSLLLAATERGLVRVAYERENHDAVLATLAERLSSRVLRAPKRLDTVVVELEEYFDGRRTSFDLRLDFSLSTGFRLIVQRALPGIGYGHTRSYRDVAVLVGNPTAVRAVGTACATNPLPIVLPCHRVLRSDGTLGGYAGGPAVKERLLALEGAA